MSAEDALPGYVYDAQARVWTRPGQHGMPYSDGDAFEDHLLTLLESAGDLRDGSDELRQAIRDWPGEYHLSPQRSNLLRALRFGPSKRVLELGCGCGALTRYLGETGAQVTALEGSTRRARIAAARCRDLANVRVVADNLIDYPTRARYDVVLLIGVLEYARVFIPGPDAVARCLAHAKAMLGDRGAMVLAIENQLGLKYFAGCREDHLGRPFVGVEDLYPAGGPVTFGAGELGALITAAGFAHQRFLFAFPDYKLPQVILSEAALADPRLDVAALLAQAAGRDHGADQLATFSDVLAWGPLARNGLVGSLANSFLVVAGSDRQSLATVSRSDQEIAWSFSQLRRRALATTTIFARHAAGIAVRKTLSHPAAEVMAENQNGAATPVPFLHRPESSRLLPGEILATNLLRLAASGATGEALVAACEPWLALLLEHAIGLPGDPPVAVGAIRLPGTLIDCIPANIIVRNGQLTPFDLEWQCRDPVPLAWVVARGLVVTFKNLLQPSPMGALSYSELLRQLLASRRITIDTSDVEQIVSMESAFFSFVTQASSTAASPPLTAEMLDRPIGGNVQRLGDKTALFEQRWRDQSIEHARVQEQLRSDASAIHGELMKLRSIYDHTFDSLAAQEAEVGRLQDELDRTSRRSADVERACLELEQQRQALQLERDACIAAMAQVEDRNIEHERVLEQLRSDASAIHGELMKLRSIYDQTFASLALQDSEVKRLQGELDRSAERTADVERACLELERKRQALQLERDARVAAMTELQEKSDREAAAARCELDIVRADFGRRLGALAHNAQQMQAMLSGQAVELAALRQERSTFGARVGRRITATRNRLAPPMTARGRLVSWVARFVETAAAQGPAAAFRRSTDFIALRLRARSPAEPGADRVLIAEPAEFDAWIRHTEPGSAELGRQRRDCASLTYRPLISVVLPIYKVPAEVLVETIASLTRQTYPDWEACVVYADHDNVSNRALLERLAREDRRLKLQNLNHNGGISENSNAALKCATGDFIALLDHDDTLAPWALYQMVEAINANPEGDFFYSDKDSIDADGRIRRNALFKPQWSPEMMYSVNYPTHFNLLRRSVVNEVGGFRRETDGAQDWDLFLRVSEKARRVVRVEGILYHWRVLPTSTATGIQAKPWAAQGQLRALGDHLDRVGLPARVVAHAECGFRLLWPQPVPDSIDVVIVATALESDVAAALNALRNSSTDGVGSITIISGVQGSDAARAAVAMFEGIWPGHLSLATVEPGTAASSTLASVLDGLRGAACLLLDGRISALSTEWVNDLVGWVLHHPHLAFATGLAVNNDGTVLEAGRIVDGRGASLPLFRGEPLHSYGWFGGALWHRNVSSAAGWLFAAVRSDLVESLKSIPPSPYDAAMMTRLCAGLRKGGRRGLVCPLARVVISGPVHEDLASFNEDFGRDPHFHPAFRGINPLRLM